ncbi:MAG TPA: peptidoglycan DD-metalloendopeptidase family protein [Nannocystis sp.]
MRLACLHFGLGALALAGCYTSIDLDSATAAITTFDPVTGSTGSTGSTGWPADPPSPTTTTGEDTWHFTTATTEDGTGDTWPLTTTGLDTTGLPDTTSTTAPDPPDTTTSTTGDPVDDCPRVRVTVPPGDVLNVRPTPSTAQPPLGTLGSGQIVDVLGIVQGEVIDGIGTWYHIKTQNLTGYVFGGWVECTFDELPKDGFFLPLECGTSALVSQGNNGGFSHVGQSAYAFDFAVGIGTPLVAIADGTVSNLYAGTLPGDPCYNGGGQECSGKANYVTLLHNDGTKSIYAHLSAVSVTLGQFVPRGTPVGLSGSTGWSTGRHAHVARQENCGSGWCQSIPVSFVDVPGDGVPETGDTVTSGNCP